MNECISVVDCAAGSIGRVIPIIARMTHRLACFFCWTWKCLDRPAYTLYATLSFFHSPLFTYTNIRTLSNDSAAVETKVGGRRSLMDGIRKVRFQTPWAQ